MKTLKKILIFGIILITVLFASILIIVKSIAVDTTDSDLPQDIYESSGDLFSIAQQKLISIPFASDEDQYSMLEEFLNYILLDSIRTNFNDAYNPLSDVETNDTNYVTYQKEFFIDYVYAKINEENQIVLCISFGTDLLIPSRSAIYLYFDVDMNIELFDLSITLTLDQYHIADKKLSFKILDFIFTQLDKNHIEESITSGILDLDAYTYTISLIS